MKKVLQVVVALLMVTGYSAAAEYWHFGLGIKGLGVRPGGDYENALGVGLVATFGDPDSRFTTQIEGDRWHVTYAYSGPKKRQYSGITVGVYEKLRALDFSSAFSAYLIGGAGGYFLELKQEEEIELIGLQLRSKFLHSRLMVAGGLGLESRLSERVFAFVEGRYFVIINAAVEDKNPGHAYFGLRYRF